MQSLLRTGAWTFLMVCVAVRAHGAGAGGNSIDVEIDWAQSTGALRSIPTVMVVPSPILRKPSAVRDAAFAALTALDARYVRYLAWFAYPRLAVAQLEPSHLGKKGVWDFRYVDSVMVPFLEATRGRDPIVSFSTLPAWMFKTSGRMALSDDPDKMDFAYAAQGTELVDSSGAALGEYQARLVRWYTEGGFRDEDGTYYRSGHRYELPWWGVLNEPELEYFTTPRQYTERYDAIVSAVRKVYPETKFMGLSLCGRRCDLRGGAQFFEYFLDPRNHRPGIPIDMVSYHFYAHLSESRPLVDWQQTLFEQADGFLNNMSYINAMRKRLLPNVKINIDELGLRIIPETVSAPKPIPENYWNLAAAYDTYLYLELAKQGIEVVTASHFIGAGDFTPSETMFDWRSGQPNARYHARKLIADHFKPAGEFVATRVSGALTKSYAQILRRDELPQIDLFNPGEVAVQGIKAAGVKRILAINKGIAPIDIVLIRSGRVMHADIVDEKSGNGLARREHVNDVTLRLGPLAVGILAVK